MELKWTKTNQYLNAITSNFQFKTKLAMFDLDSTLIVPKIGKFGKGKGFPVDENDWKFSFPNVKSTIEQLVLDNYSIIIISNQGGMACGKQTFEVWSNKLNQICKKLGVELYVFCAVDHNKYRKPFRSWFDEFIPENIKNNLDRKNSFYCGDSCGRKGDFSDTDYKFALNCMVKFKIPENLFNGQIQKIPKVIYPQIFNNYTNPSFTFKPSEQKEMVLMVGYQGSGKSFIANKIANNYGYIIINQDTLKSKEKCVTACENVMKQSKSLIIDKTNPDKESRAFWIKIAKQHNYQVRLILLTTSRELAKHNNYFRHLTTNIPVVPEIAYRMYSSKFQKPSTEEGILEIIETSCGKPKNLNYYDFLY